MAELSFGILSLNTAGLGDYEKRRKVFNCAKQQTSRNGIIFLQETHTTKNDDTVWTNQFGCGRNSVIFSHGKSDARRVLIAFYEAIKYEIVSKHIDNDGRYIILNFTDNNSIVLVNYCASNNETEQVKILEESNCIFDTLDNHEDTKYIL